MVDINLKFRVVVRYVLLLSLMGTVIPALGQTTKTMLVEPRGPLLPLRFGAWEIEGAPPSCRDCFQAEGQVADVLKKMASIAATRSPTVGKKARGRWR